MNQALMMNRTTMKLRIALCAIALFGLTVSANADVEQETSFAGNYLASRSAVKLRDNRAATDYVAAALKQDDQNPILIERLFQLQLAAGNLTKAEDAALKVIGFNSQHRMARIVLGLKEFRDRRYGQARDHFSEAGYTPVGELTSTLLTAWSYAGEGSLNAALKELDKLDTQASFANFKAFHAALIADYLNSNVRADAAYKKAYDMAGTSLRVVQAYGNFLERNGRNAEAQKIYQGFLAEVKHNVLVESALGNALNGKKPEPFINTPGAGAGEALFSLASAMNDEQSIDVAQLYAQLALSFSNDKPVKQSLLGDIYTDMKSYQDAVSTFEQIPQMSPLRVYADTQIAMNLQRLDKSPEAVARLKLVLSKEPKNMDALTSLGNIYRITDKFAEAVEAYGEAIKLIVPGDNSNWQIYYNRGIAFDRQKNFEKSEADFRQALAMSKDEPSVLNYLGYSMIDRGVKLDEAIAMVKKAVDLRPNDGYIVDSLGWAYFTMRDYEQAANYLERAVDLNPSDPTIAEHLGDAYWQVGRKTEAYFQWDHSKVNGAEGADLERVLAKIKNGYTDSKAVVKQ
jgi:tetratricopeptide (TPR) repeat protein